ncbi:MAG TPA: O-antigen ligase family protein [Roseiflexaceae bacterium]|jgi:O-antigen ligase|nr:O-antigen ligase family protein [Roseiflexaceae bacterium]
MLGKVLRQRTDWSNNPILVAAGAVLLGVAGGAAVAFGPYWAAFAALVALAFGYALLVNTSLGLATVIGIATILPFGTLPFKALITPNFLELALIALLGVWLLRLLLRHDESLYLTPLGLPIAGFIGLTLFSFIIGSNGSPDTLTLHNYFKFVLAVLFFFSVVNCVRTREQARQVFRMLIIGGAISAVIGLVLYFMNDAAALRLLTSLGRIGYPTSGRVLRYIEDNTSGVERAIGLAVDPNSFGGMLALVGALAATQVVSERPILPRKLLALLSGVILLALFLTYSRAALGGMVVAAMYVATLRYRRLWWLILAAGVVAVLLFVGLGVGEQFVQRVTEGIQFRDEANQMRLAEFQNAINIIKAYPFFGIGFGQAPELDLVAGVSNIYLAIAQRTGLIGLAAFLSIMGLFYARTWQMLRAATARRDEELSAWIVSLQAGMAAALAVGLLDHYFFNIEFSHMVALFWGCIGLAMALDKV